MDKEYLCQFMKNVNEFAGINGKHGEGDIF
jgi:hypothetical protein